MVKRLRERTANQRTSAEYQLLAAVVMANVLLSYVRCLVASRRIFFLLVFAFSTHFSVYLTKKRNISLVHGSFVSIVVKLVIS